MSGLLRFSVGSTAYVEEVPDEMWALLGARRVFAWLQVDQARGCVITRGGGAPMICTKHPNHVICEHKAAVRRQMTREWDTSPEAA